MQYLIGTDIGTSGTKSIVMDTDGQLLASAYEEYGVINERPLWAEQWPAPWNKAVLNTIRDAVAKANVPKDSIKGLCVSGLYGGSGIPLDEGMQPVRPCMIWMDRRAQQQSANVEETVGFKRLFEVTQNGLDPYYGYTKILWIRDNEPENWAKTKLFLPPNAYAIYELTGEVAIDHSSAGNLGGIYDMEKRCWSDEMLDKLGIPRSMMPERIVDSCDVVGGVKDELADELGVPRGLPVSAGGVDCTVAALGLGLLKPGQHVAIIGTSMTWGFIHEGDQRSEQLISMPYVMDPKRLTFTFGGAATAGALVRWFRNEFAKLEYQQELAGSGNVYRELDDEAAKLPIGSGGVITLPYFMGERAPIWDVNARGVIYGLSLAHTRAHVYRAFLEAVAFSLKHSMQDAHGGALSGELILAGGVSKSRLWRQIIADVTGFTVVSPKNDVEANLGDVVLSGMGTGVFGADVTNRWQVFGEPTKPDMEAHKQYEVYYQRYLSLYESTKGLMRSIAESEATEA